MRPEGDWGNIRGSMQASYKVSFVTLLLAAVWRMDGQEAKLAAAGLGSAQGQWLWRGRTRWVRETFRTVPSSRILLTEVHHDVSI